MPEAPKKTAAEETLLFMAILTFVGGYMNVYTFLNRGGAFVTFHTGNLARVGLSAYLGDFEMFISCAVPVAGCLLGSILAQFLKTACGKRISPLSWQRTTLLAEVATMLAVGLLPSTVPDMAVNFVLSVVSTFQLSNFRKYEGAVHNSTIQTGNLRTLGQHIADCILKRNKAALVVTARYFLLVSTFPIGILVGGYVSSWLGTFSILPCCVLVAYAAFGCLTPAEPAAQKS